jgi:hypothetical protein
MLESTRLVDVMKEYLLVKSCEHEGRKFIARMLFKRDGAKQPSGGFKLGIFFTRIM